VTSSEVPLHGRGTCRRSLRSGAGRMGGSPNPAFLEKYAGDRKDANPAGVTTGSRQVMPDGAPKSEGEGYFECECERQMGLGV
jgi:hypothetical protein